MVDVVLLADQPFQIVLCSQVAKLLRSQKISSKIVLVDYFTFIYGQDFIMNEARKSGVQIITAENMFREWQSKGEPVIPEDYSQYLNYWSSNFCRARSLDTLLRTDLYTNAFERQAMLLPLSENWKKKIHYDTLKWCENIFNKLKPRLFISISMNLLPTNALYELSNYNRISFVSFLDSRISNRWVARTDLGYGMSQSLYLQIISNEYISKDNREVEQFLRAFKLKVGGSYNSLAQEIISGSNKYSGSLLKFVKLFIFELISWFRMSIKMLIFGSRRRAFKVRRLDQSFPRHVIFEFKRRLGPFRIRFDKHFISDTSTLANFFYWALHDRPEGSGLVLGDGKDEVEELLRFADLLPENTFLAVKETPLIYGIRSRKFYTRLIDHPRIVLIDPFVDSKEMILKSEAVVGISGTVLLEAAMLSRPSWAIGKPEFLPALVGSGWQNLDTFVSRVLNKSISIEDIEIRIRKYLKFIFDNSTIGDSSLGGNENPNPHEMKHDVQRIFENIVSNLNA
jgi:hypothetical protein